MMLVAGVVPSSTFVFSSAVGSQALGLGTRLKLNNLALHKVIAMQTEPVAGRTASSLADRDLL
jgi:hypothetical protein